MSILAKEGFEIIEKRIWYKVKDTIHHAYKATNNGYRANNQCYVHSTLG